MILPEMSHSALYNLRKILNRHRNFTLVIGDESGQRKSAGVSLAFRPVRFAEIWLLMMMLISCERKKLFLGAEQTGRRNSRVQAVTNKQGGETAVCKPSRGGIRAVWLIGSLTTACVLYSPSTSIPSNCYIPSLRFAHVDLDILAFIVLYTQLQSHA